MHMGMKTLTAEAVTIEKTQSGICAGTSVMTLNGEMPIEHMSVGDRVITRDSGMAVLRDVTSETIMVQPICIKAGSLGHTRPDRDMLVSPGVQIHIRDWRAEALFGATTANIAAERLLDGEFLAKQPMREMKVFKLHFDTAHIIYADGIEMLS